MSWEAGFVLGMLRVKGMVTLSVGPTNVSLIQRHLFSVHPNAIEQTGGCTRMTFGLTHVVRRLRRGSYRG